MEAPITDMKGDGGIVSPRDIRNINKIITCSVPSYRNNSHLPLSGGRCGQVVKCLDRQAWMVLDIVWP